MSAKPRGRPPLPESERKQSLNVMFPKWVLEEISERAEAEDTTMGEVIRQIVERSLKRSAARKSMPVSTLKPASPATQSALADIFATIAEEEDSESLRTASGKLRKASKVKRD
jgi:hypothetical protein